MTTIALPVLCTGELKMEIVIVLSLYNYKVIIRDKCDVRIVVVVLIGNPLKRGTVFFRK